MVNSAEFGKRLQIILDYYSLTATAFSETIDFNRSTISHLLSGRNRPSLEFVLKVLQNFPEVELYWLLNGTGNFPATKKEIHPSYSNKAHLTNKEVKKTESPSKLRDIPKESETLSDNNDIEQVILLYKDGRFKVFEN